MSLSGDIKSELSSLINCIHECLHQQQQPADGLSDDWDLVTEEVLESLSASTNPGQKKVAMQASYSSTCVDHDADDCGLMMMALNAGTACATQAIPFEPLRLESIPSLRPHRDFLRLLTRWRHVPLVYPTDAETRLDNQVVAAEADAALAARMSSRHLNHHHRVVVQPTPTVPAEVPVASHITLVHGELSATQLRDANEGAEALLRAAFECENFTQDVLAEAKAKKQAKVVDVEEDEDDTSWLRSNIGKEVAGSPAQGTGVLRGFSTAGGKSVSISSAAMQQAQRLLSSVTDALPDDPDDAGKKAESVGRPAISGEVGFSTAGGKSVNVSTAAMHRAQRLLSAVNDESENLNSEDNLVNKEPSVKPKELDAGGFSTAGGKSVNVSSAALLRARRLLASTTTADVEEEQQEVENKIVSISKPTTSGGGFSTAGGRSVQVSAAAVQRARQLLASADDIEDNDSAAAPAGCIKNISGGGDGGFSTAGGRSVQVSASALARARRLLLADETDAEEVPDTAEETPQLPPPPPPPPQPRTPLPTLTPRHQKRFPPPTSSLSSHNRTPGTSTSATRVFRFKPPSIATTPSAKVITAAAAASAPPSGESTVSGLGELSCARLRFATSGQRHQLAPWTPSPSTIPNAAPIDFDSAAEYRFDGAPGAGVGFEELFARLATQPGVRVSVLPEGWARNHYRLLVWRLSTAVAAGAPQAALSGYFSSSHVLHQLRYRYDREVVLGHRSSIRRILERDSPAGHRMVLCVASLKWDAADKDRKQPNIVLTDGWYSVSAQFDPLLSRAAASGSIAVGCKLLVCQAELCSPSDSACHPLEPAATGTLLRLHGNSTRRCARHLKLGFASVSGSLGPFPVTLGSLKPDGGRAGLLRLLVCRRYPMQYMERTSEDSAAATVGGSATRVFRSARAEELRAREFEAGLHRRMEDAAAEFTAPASNRPDQQQRTPKRRLWQPEEVRSLRTGEELLSALHTALNADELQAWLSEWQLDCLTQHRERVMREKLGDCGERKVTPLLRILVAGTEDSDVDGCATALLTIWNPSGQMDWMKEGCGLLAVGATVAAAAASSGTQVSLSLSRSSIIRPLDLGSRAALISAYRSRCFLRLPTATGASPTSSLAAQTRHQEADARGLLVAVWDSGRMLALLGDPERGGDATGLLAIRVWVGLDKLGLAGVARPGRMVAAFNLQHRFGNGGGSELAPSIPMLYFADLSDLSADARHFVGCPKPSVASLEAALAAARRRLVERAGVTAFDETATSAAAPSIAATHSPSLSSTTISSRSSLQRQKMARLSSAAAGGLPSYDVESPLRLRQSDTTAITPRHVISAARQPGLRRSSGVANASSSGGGNGRGGGGLHRRQPPAAAAAASPTTTKTAAAQLATDASSGNSSVFVGSSGNGRKRHSGDSAATSPVSPTSQEVCATSADLSIADLVKTKRRSVSAASSGKS